jgi:hypothetical protein
MHEITLDTIEDANNAKKTKQKAQGLAKKAIIKWNRVKGGDIMTVEECNETSGTDTYRALANNI